MKKYCSPVNIKLKNFKTKFQDKKQHCTDNVKIPHIVLQIV